MTSLSERRGTGWPPKAILSIYFDGELVAREEATRKFDLSDAATKACSDSFPCRIYLGVRSMSKAFEGWSSEEILKCESFIRYDLGFDGFEASICQIKARGLNSKDEALWELNIDGS